MTQLVTWDFMRVIESTSIGRAWLSKVTEQRGRKVMLDFKHKNQALSIVGKTVAEVICGKHRDELCEIKFTDSSSLTFLIGSREWLEEWIEVEYDKSPAEWEIYCGR